jgi:hypothetical protein
VFRRRRTHWTALVTALTQTTAADLKAEMLSTRILQEDARQRGERARDEDLGRHLDTLIEQLVTLHRG